VAVDGRWFGFAKIKGESLRFIWFNLMPWPYLPDDFREKYRSVWVDIPSSLYDPPIAFVVELAVLVVQTRQVLPSGAYLDRDCFVAVLLAMTSTYAVIASKAKQSRRGPVREQASGLHH
jgi:hypothetical protein